MSPFGVWGTAQSGTNCAIATPGNSIDLLFNDAAANCATSANGNWTYTALSEASFGPVGAVTLDARFYASAWPNGTLTIEVSNNNGTSYSPVATYNSSPTGLPPALLTTLSLDVSPYFTTQAQVNNARVRFNWTGVSTARTMYVDEVRLSITTGANPTPTLPPPGPLQTVGPDDPHRAYNGSTDKCAACHSAHAAVGPSVLNSAWPEAALKTQMVMSACAESARAQGQRIEIR